MSAAVHGRPPTGQQAQGRTRPASATVQHHHHSQPVAIQAPMLSPRSLIGAGSAPAHDTLWSAPQIPLSDR